MSTSNITYVERKGGIIMANILLSAFGILLAIFAITLVLYLCINFFIEDYEYITLTNIHRSIKEENNSWIEFDLLYPNNTIECVQEIIDDALCYGFEFKIENYKLYYREID